MVQVWMDTFIMLILTAMKTGAAAPSMAAWKVDLFQNNINPARGDALSAYTIATFSGYAQVDLTVTGPYPDSVNGPFDLGGECNFVVGATPTIGNSIYGYVVSDGSGNIVCAANFVNGPIPMNTPGALISFVPQFRLRDYSLVA